MTESIGRNKLAFVVAIAIIALCVLFLVSFFWILGEVSAAYGQPMTPGYVLQQLLEAGGLVLVLLLVLMLGLVFIRTGRDFFARILVWGTMLVSLVGSSGFLLGMYTLPSYSIGQILSALGSFVPLICIVVVLISLIVQWEDKNKLATRVISIAAIAASAVFSVLQLLQIDPVMVNDTMLYLVFFTTTVAPVLVSLFVLLSTRSRRAFHMVWGGLSSEEAVFIEEAEDELEAVREKLEEEAIQKLEKQLEDELKDTLVERAFEVVIEQTEELEKHLEAEVDGLENAEKTADMDKSAAPKEKYALAKEENDIS
ncbi:MAG: hypothetical protein ACOYJB_02975 [Christensenellaceae bacterium]|jgi:hypothetical protein